MMLRENGQGDQVDMIEATAGPFPAEAADAEAA